ncbi:MAG: fumarate reductase/succinate dehydrogenase flavoprotein subunit, partial [Caldilinea sp.]|nr:fumarate reductase/succinate dehydrogenase flavoprotein subunit [Caldilinea sp.]
HGANRLGASALMQGLADGYFVLPSTLPNYIASTKLEKVDENADAVKEAVANVQGITKRLMSVKGTKSVDHYHRELGKIVWDYCGMSRTAEGLEKALTLIPE